MNKYLEEGLNKKEYIFLQLDYKSMISQFYKTKDQLKFWQIPNTTEYVDPLKN